MRFLLVTGLSGAGKTSVNRYLEDMGAFCVDNLPPNMMFKMMEAFEQSSMRCPAVAMAVDVRSADFFDAKSVSDLISETRGLGYSIESIYLEASDEALVSRYKETRRDHPLAGQCASLTDAIAHERELMQPLREKGPEGVRETIAAITNDLRYTMAMTASADVRSIDPGVVRLAKHTW